MATIVLLGTLDTKGREYAFLRKRRVALDVECVLVDAGVGELELDVNDERFATAMANRLVELIEEER